LIELEKILKEDVRWQPDDFKIRVTFDDCSIEADAFESLFQMDLPGESTDELSVGVIGWTEDQHIDRGVTLRTHHLFVDYQIHSKNEGWYLAKIRRLTLFFRRMKPWYSFITTHAPTIATLLAVAAVLLLSFALSTGHWLLSIAPGLLFILAVAFGWLSYQGKIFPYARVSFTPRTKHAPNYELIAIIIGLCTLVVGVITLIIAWPA
jgi:hypothetical protein